MEDQPNGVVTAVEYVNGGDQMNSGDDKAPMMLQVNRENRIKDTICMYILRYIRSTK